jgi:hypothetical protein
MASAIEVEKDKERSQEMKTKKMLWVTVLVVLLVMAMGGAQVSAVGPYGVVADTYTDVNSVNMNHGSDQTLLLSGTSAGACCTASTYVWLKFNVPDTTATISENSQLSIPLLAGANVLMDLELRSSSNTSWDENTLTWANQPALDAQVLAVATNPAPGSDALFSGSDMATYLNNHKGQVVTLVVMAHCPNVGVAATRYLRAKEYTGGGSGIELILQGPTAVSLQSLSGTLQESFSLPLTIVLACLLALVAGLKFYLIKNR